MTSATAALASIITAMVICTACVKAGLWLAETWEELKNENRNCESGNRNDWL